MKLFLTTTFLLLASIGFNPIITNAQTTASNTPATTPSSTDDAAEEPKALLVAMKASGPALAVSTYVFIAIGLLTNVDVTPLVWHAQWVTFAPFLEGYAGNNTMIWAEVAPPKGNNPNGVPFVFEEWGSNFWPLALNISWIDMTDSIAADFITTDATTCVFEDAADDTSGRRLVNIETCSFKDRRNIKRATTFVNVCFSYLIVGLLFAALQLGLHFGYTKKVWDAYIGGTHWIKERDDLDQTKPWTFLHVPLTGPRIFFAFIYYVAWQPMIFGCMLAISTSHGKWVAVGLIMFILTIVVPFFYQTSWVKKHVMGSDASTLEIGQHKCTYVKDWKGWRDIQDRGNHHTWRKSKVVAGYGILFKDYYAKWKGWLSYWLFLQIFVLTVMSPLITNIMPAKIQAVIIMAIYFMYFVTTALMMPFRQIPKYLMHLAMCAHNGGATVLTQFLDPEGLFGGDGEVGTASITGATDADGTLIAACGFGIIFLICYIGFTVIFKLIALTQEKAIYVEEENTAEFIGRGKKKSKNGVKRMNTADRDLGALDNNAAHARNQSSMLQAMMAGGNMKRATSNSSNGSESKADAAAGSNSIQLTLKKAEPVEPNKPVAVVKSAAAVIKPVAAVIKPAVVKPAAAANALPEHWREVEDPVSGKKYFHHKKNNSTQWHRPTAETPASGGAASSSLPADWLAVQDPASGRTYYANRKTSQTSWTIPTE